MWRWISKAQENDSGSQRRRGRFGVGSEVLGVGVEQNDLGAGRQGENGRKFWLVAPESVELGNQFCLLCPSSRLPSFSNRRSNLSASQSCSSTAPVQNSPCVEMATGRMRGARDRRPESQISCRSTMASRRAYLSRFLVCASNTAADLIRLPILPAVFRSLVRRSSFRSFE